VARRIALEMHVPAHRRVVDELRRADSLRSGQARPRSRSRRRAPAGRGGAPSNGSARGSATGCPRPP